MFFLVGGMWNTFSANACSCLDRHIPFSCFEERFLFSLRYIKIIHETFFTRRRNSALPKPGERPSLRVRRVKLEFYEVEEEKVETET